MKSIKRLVALFMIAAMVFGLNITAFADTYQSVQVTISKPVSANSGAYYLSTNVNVPVESRSYTTPYTDIENMSVGTAYDAIYLATTTLNSARKQYMADDGSGNWYYINRFGLQVEGINGYNQEYSDVVTQTIGDIQYHTVTYGYWNLEINGNYAPNYSTYYTVDQVTSVSLTWDSYSYNYTVELD